MGADQTRRSLNQYDKEIADLEKKMADYTKKEADINRKMNDAQKTIQRTSSSSMQTSKLRQISSLQNDLVRVTKDKADVSKKIADKRTRRNDTYMKLQKEELIEQKEAAKKQRQVHDDYERRISELSNQLKQKISDSTKRTSVHSLYDDNSSGEEYDVFISHASEDKGSFANALKESLATRGVKVWYDNQCIVWGDSLRAKIDDGLKKSRYGIVILSQSYIKKGWTQYELDGLFQIEMTCGKTILPIWHNISKQEVQDFSPTLAGKMAMNTAMMTADEIADELVSLLGITNEMPEEVHNGEIENA